jgi:hypothetical protein
MSSWQDCCHVSLSKALDDMLSSTRETEKSAGPGALLMPSFIRIVLELLQDRDFIPFTPLSERHRDEATEQEIWLATVTDEILQSAKRKKKKKKTLPRAPSEVIKGFIRFPSNLPTITVQWMEILSHLAPK